MRALIWSILFMYGVSVGPHALAEVVYAPQQPQLSPANYNMKLQSFPDVRDELLKLITKAKRRVWLATDFLTDGEIVTALYLAKYRGLDVQVLLGRERANEYLSRLHYLKKQDTRVSLKPADFASPGPTALLIDRDLIVLDADLDFRTRATAFALRSVGPREAQAFADRFAENSGKLPAVAPDMPLVGRANTGRRAAPWLPPRSSDAPPTIPAAVPFMPMRPTYVGEQDGSFNYNKNRNPQKPGSGIPRTLPKTLKSQQRQNGGR